jgi:predicted dehydrogenase
MARPSRDNEHDTNLVPDSDSTPDEHGGATRRDFLKMAGLTAAGTILAGATGVTGANAAPTGPRVALGKASPKVLKGASIKPTVQIAKGRVLGANDRINIAHIGVGGQGGSHMYLLGENAQANNTQSIAVCDVWQKRLDGAKDAVLKRTPGATVQSVADYRAILDNKDVDAVVIATPEHWHAQIAVDAMEAGKHVYCEKPMTRYMDEAFAIEAAVKRTGKVLQVGSQGCSEARWQVASKAVRDGKIGPVVSCQGSYARNSKEGEWNWPIDATAGPDNLDWKAWLGTAPDRPWNDDSRERYFRYRKFRDYSAGLIGDLLPHKLHPLMLVLFGDKPEFPTTVTAIGTRKISTDREVADTVHVLAEFAGGQTMYVYLSTVNEQGLEDMIRGHKATLRFGGNVRLSPERPFSEEIDAEDLPVNDPGEHLVLHEKDWLASIRENRKPICPIELALPVQTIVSLAEMSEVQGKTMHFDPVNRKIVA